MDTLSQYAMFRQSRLEEVTDENLNFVECPECGYDGSDSSQGFALHYGYNHEGDIKYLFRCEECTWLKFGASNQTYCSKYCEIYNRVGTFKHFDKQFLKEEIEEKSKRAVQVADEIDVDPTLIHKWVEKLEVGDEYDCPSCDKSYATNQGVSKHHIDEHGESIAEFTHTCENCGREFTGRKSENNHIAPRFCSQECYGESISGEDNPNKDPERAKQISETMKEVHEKSLGDYGERNAEWMRENVIEPRDDDYLYEDNDNIRDGSLISEPQYVEESDRYVCSSWEKKVDILFHKSDLEYQYEPKRFELGSRKYMPDFLVGKSVIEVKGYVDGDAQEKAKRFMEIYSEYEYIVVGSEIPCDKHFEWEDREEVIDYLTE